MEAFSGEKLMFSHLIGPLSTWLKKRVAAPSSGELL
jgi:uncharacterized Tic20 family protein